jgi:hypothetical protein
MIVRSSSKSGTAYILPLIRNSCRWQWIHQADADHAARRFITKEEAIVVRDELCSLGLNPKIVNWETVTETTIEAPKTAPAEEAATDKTPEVQGVISKIKDFLTSDGRRMVSFKTGPHNCRILGKPAEFVATHAQEYEGKLIKLYGVWKLNERGRMAFFPEERIAATDPSGEVTADEVQKALEEALFEGSGLRSVGGPTFEEMEAEYKERGQVKKSEQQAESSAVAA